MTRKIELQMQGAIIARKNWTSGNTMVSYEEGNRISRVYLHGNKIAEVGDNFVKMNDCGWQTVTTKSRLNAILEVCSAGNRIFQKKGDWFIRTADGVILFDGEATLY